MNELEPKKLNQKEEEIRDIIQSEIYSCALCQPYDSGEVVWVIGEQINISELFFGHELNDDQIERICTHLQCPWCGADNIESYSEIGVKPHYEIISEKIIKDSSEKYGESIFELQKTITQYPFLVYKHPLANKIYCEIEKKQFPITEITGQYYRVREVRNSEVLLSKRMTNPPIGKSKAGRFNHPGQSHYYLSENKDTAIQEVVVDKDAALVWIQKFNIETKIENILDLSYSIEVVSPTFSTLYVALKLYDRFNLSNLNNENWKPDYYLTRFIMDCAKQLGYNGIKYNSSKVSYNKNLVIFYPDKFDIKPIDEPVIEKHKIKKEDDWFEF